MLVVGAAVWVAAIFTAPVAASSARPSVNAVAAGTYVIGSFVCHQKPERSFHIAGRPVAVCGRCTGLYLSALAGGMVAFFAKPRRLRRERLWLIAAAAPTAISWLAEQSGLARQSNAIRATAALPLGFIAAVVVIGMLLSMTRTPRRDAGAPAETA